MPAVVYFILHNSPHFYKLLIIYPTHCSKPRCLQSYYHAGMGGMLQCYMFSNKSIVSQKHHSLHSDMYAHKWQYCIYWALGVVMSQNTRNRPGHSGNHTKPTQILYHVNMEIINTFITQTQKSFINEWMTKTYLFESHFSKNCKHNKLICDNYLILSV